MTETPSEQQHPQSQTPISAVDPSSLEYWCYACDKVVPGEIHVDHPDIVCLECKNWYIEFVGPPPPLPTSLASYSVDQLRFGKQFLQALSRFSRLAPDEDPPPLNQPYSAMQTAEVFGQHCLYVLRFSSQVGDRGVVAPPNQQFLFDVGDLRSRSQPSFTFNPIDELRAGEQFLCMLRLISQRARDNVVPPNQPPVDESSDQTPFCTQLYSFLLEEQIFSGRFLRMLCLITQIARDEEVESPNQPLTDSWDLVEQIIQLYEPEYLIELYLPNEIDPENLIDDSDEIDYLGQQEEDNSGHEIEGEEYVGGGGDVYETYIRREPRLGGNLARLDLVSWANVEAGIEVLDRHRGDDLSPNFRDRDYDLSPNFQDWDDDLSPNFRGGIEVLDRDRDDDQSPNFRGGYNEDEDGYEIQDETRDYVGNPGDYLDTATYETLLQFLAENVDHGGRPGAPPASKGVVEALETLKIKGEGEILACAICQDTVNIGEMAKKLPCGHKYHEDCILPWLGSRNSCPLCRYELPTDYLDYEEERKKKVVATTAAAESSSRGAGGDESDYDTEDHDGDGGGDSYFDTELV